jgi:SAM-dependent methyltransferase
MHGRIQSPSNSELSDSVDPFANRDIDYFKQHQYRTTEQLNSRVNLHEKYSSSNIDWFTWLHKNIDWTVASNVLEVGCGTGLFWDAVPKLIAPRLSVLLSDLSVGMVYSALTRARPSLDNVSGLVADVQCLPLKDSSADLVIANQMLYHVPDLDGGLSELGRVLKQGGTLVAATVGPHHLKELFELKKKVFGGSSRTTHADVFGSTNGDELLSAFFLDVTWTQFDDRLICTDEGDVETYLRSTPPGETASVEALRALRAEITNVFEVGGGVFEVTKDVGVFIAKSPK